LGHINQYEFVRKRRPEIKGPILEIGSRDYGNTQNVRELFPDTPYVGVDMSQGDGVDVVIDLTRPFDEIDETLGRRRFGTVFCFSVLEHCAQPFAMADGITRLLAPGGAAILSVPFAWKFHGYPSDYWRFTHEGVKLLFPSLRFDDAEGEVFHPIEGDTGPINRDLGRMHLSGTQQRRGGHPVRGAVLSALKLMGPLNPVRFITRYPYIMAATSIIMVGRKGVSPVEEGAIAG
jgi:hypothetical protein